jgi:hypothetical protein
MILSTVLTATGKAQKYGKQYSKLRTAMNSMARFNAVKADNIVVPKKELVASLMHSSNYMNLAHFEAKTWELKASTVYHNLEKFGASSVFDVEDSIEWATGSVEKNVGEWVYVKYQFPYIVSMVRVKQRKVFAQMVRRIDIYFEAGESRQILLLPEVHEQEFFINPPVLTSVVRFEIVSVYGEAITGLNTVQVFGQHRSAADLTLKYDIAASKLQKLKEQTQHVDASLARTHKEQLLYESKVLHAKMMLASDEAHIRAEGAKAILECFSEGGGGGGKAEHHKALPHHQKLDTAMPQEDDDKVLPRYHKELPHVFSSALCAYAAYVQTCHAPVQQHYAWLPFSSSDTPREQGEKLLILAIETFAANADAQLRLASSYALRVAESPVEERQNWCTEAELNFQTTLVKDPQNVMALYLYALFLEEHLTHLSQAIELYRRAARCFCANKQLQASVMCSLATALQRRGRLQINSQVNIFSVREEEEEAGKRAGAGAGVGGRGGGGVTLTPD